MSTRANKPAFTLVEALISLVIFFMLLVVCGELAVAGMRVRAKTEDKNQVFREATIAMDKLNRDLGQCLQIYSPSPLAIEQDIYPGDTAPPLVFHTLSTRNAGSPDVVVGYSFNQAQRSLTRIVYAGDYPASQTPVEPPLVLASSLDLFAVRLLNPNTTFGTPTLRIQMNVSTVYKGQTGPSLPLVTHDRLRGL